MWMRVIDEPSDSADNTYRPGIHVKKGAAVVITLAVSRAELDEQLAMVLTSLLVAAAGLLVGTILLLNLTIRRVLRPLHEVCNQASGIDEESLDNRFPVRSMPRELQPICSRLNDLLSRLETAFRRQRRFAANVAHELRTPIAELRSLA